MAWRRLTKADLGATISQKEIDAYRQSAPAGTDAVADLLSRTAEMARGYCRANRAVKLPADGESVPGSLVAACCDYAAYDVLKRQPVPVGEDRRKAYEEAMRILRDVAEGRTTPEGHGEAEDAASGTVAVQVAVSSRRRVTSEKLEGL